VRKLLLAGIASLALCGGAHAQVGPPNSVLCNQFVNFTGTGAAATVITGVAGKAIYLCGWHITSTSSTTTTFQITAGTTATCGTGTVTVTPALNVTITAPSSDHIEFATLSFPGPANICVNAPAAVNGGLWAGQY
jgi:hypothetical protein